MNDKTSYLHKLTNQRKRFEKWDIAEEYKKEYLDLIDKHMAIENEKNLKIKRTIMLLRMYCVLCVEKYLFALTFTCIIEFIKIKIK